MGFWRRLFACWRRHKADNLWKENMILPVFADSKNGGGSPCRGACACVCSVCWLLLHATAHDEYSQIDKRRIGVAAGSPWLLLKAVNAAIYRENGEQTDFDFIWMHTKMYRLTPSAPTAQNEGAESAKWRWFRFFSFLFFFSWLAACVDRPSR